MRASGMKPSALAVLLLVLGATSVCLVLFARRLERLPDAPPSLLVSPHAGAADAPPFLRVPSRLQARRPGEPAAAGGHEAGRSEPGEPGEGDILANEYVVAFFSADDQEAFARLARARGIEILGRMQVGNLLRLRTASAEQWEQLLRDGPTPTAVSFNFRVHLPPPPELQPMAADPGGYVAFGPNSLDWLGVDTDRAEWGRGVTIAVLDTGVDGQAGLPEANIVRTSLVDGNTYTDPVGHGTAIASLLLGRPPDVEGLVPGADVLSIRVMAANGEGDTFTVAQGIVDAVNRGAQVISLSLGTQGDSLALRQAVDYALQRGVVVVAASGNEAVEGLLYPSRYDGVLAVGAVDAARRHLYFSNRGDELDLVAPGLGIQAARPGEATGWFSGTSAAVPFVSGAAAMLLAGEARLTAADVARILLANSDDEGLPGPDAQYGAGVLDLERVLERDTAGIHDAAVGHPALSPQADTNRFLVVATVQNRGTEELARVRLTVEVAGRETVREFTRLAVGDTVACDVPVARSELESEAGLQVNCAVSTPGVEDDRPANDTRSVVLRAPAP